jgi:hypothetical protein
MPRYKISEIFPYDGNKNGVVLRSTKALQYFENINQQLGASKLGKNGILIKYLIEMSKNPNIWVFTYRNKLVRELGALLSLYTSLKQ